MARCAARRRPGDHEADAAGPARARGAGSLFERLVADEEGEETPSASHPVDARVRSIKRNLHNILNARLGGAAACPQLGLGEFGAGVFSHESGVADITGAIHGCICAYEPRIVHAEVEHSAVPGDPTTQHFTVIAWMGVDSSDERLRVDMAVQDGRLFKIS